jgi:hypothetical protein
MQFYILINKYANLKTPHTMQTKMKPGLGKNGYEQYLIKQHYKELHKLLEEWNVSHDKITIIMGYHQRKVKTENIISLYTHPISVFLDHLLDNTLSDLYQFTSSTNNWPLKKQMVAIHIQEFIQFKNTHLGLVTYKEILTDFYLMKKGFKTQYITIK